MITISQNEVNYFFSEIRLRYLLYDSTNRDAFPFESQMTGCLVNEIHRTSLTTDGGTFDIVLKYFY